MFLSWFDFRVSNGGYGFVQVNDSMTLDVKQQDIEEFDGAVIYGELREHHGQQSYCMGRFKTIVEPPTSLEKFFGITLESKIQKAVRKMKSEANKFIRNGGRKEKGNLFGMVMSIV